VTKNDRSCQESIGVYAFVFVTDNFAEPAAGCSGEVLEDDCGD
jgi:hypothetical protein